MPMGDGNDPWAYSGCAQIKLLILCRLFLRGLCFCILFRLILLITLLEALHATGGIDKALFAGEKRMALRTEFYGEVLSHRGDRLDRSAACAGYRHIGTLWMDLFLHDELL